MYLFTRDKVHHSLLSKDIYMFIYIYRKYLADVFHVLFHLQSFHSRLNQTFFLLFYININKKCFNHCRLYILIIVQIN